MSACAPTAAQKRTFNHFGLVPGADLKRFKRKLDACLSDFA
jgi:hypothetical protein